MIDWNATRAAIDAGYSEKTAREIGRENLTKPDIKERIDEIRSNLEKAAGLSAIRVLNELKAVAFSSIADFKDSWDTEIPFEDLTDEQKKAISEIYTEVVQLGGSEGAGIVQKRKFKLHDKLGAIDRINKMMGYNAPEKLETTNTHQFADWTEEQLKQEDERLSDKGSD